MKIRLLVVDDIDNMITMVKEYFSDKKDFEVVFTASNGLEAMNIIDSKKDEFDVILLDILMPVKDGMFVLETMREKGIKKPVIVLTSYSEHDTIQKISEYGIKYIALKPFDFPDLEKKIVEIYNKKSVKNNVLDLQSSKMEINITNLLHELGIPSHIKGYRYIRSAIIMVYNNPDFVGGITKELYPEIAKEYKTSVSRVERAVRHAIEVSWCRGSYELMEEIFGHSVDIDKAKPTNSEFIVTIADKLKLEMIKVR